MCGLGGRSTVSLSGHSTVSLSGHGTHSTVSLSGHGTHSTVSLSGHCTHSTVSLSGHCTHSSGGDRPQVCEVGRWQAKCESLSAAVGVVHGLTPALHRFLFQVPNRRRRLIY